MHQSDIAAKIDGIDVLVPLDLMVADSEFTQNQKVIRTRSPDFVVMCRKDVEEPLKLVRHVLERRDLSLNEAKTHVVDATQASFDFLGFTIQMSRGTSTGKPYPNVRNR